MNGSSEEFLRQGVFLDLEVDRHGRITHVGATRDAQSFESKQTGARSETWKKLNRFLAGATFVAGHNLLDHDLPILRDSAPDVRLEDLPIVDSLHLSPLAFPAVPYHRLVKDYKLVSDSRNDPVADCRLSAQVLTESWEALAALHRQTPAMAALYRETFSSGPGARGFELFFDSIGAEPFDRERHSPVLRSDLSDRVCRRAFDELLEEPRFGPALAYAIAWLRVSGTGSVVPSWVRRQYPDVHRILRNLRDLPCGDSTCSYCSQIHDPETQLKLYFGYDGFRNIGGRPRQREIVLAGMRDEPLLAILPTGSGKSLCFQVPALVRHLRRGSLTIVISPLQALMKDQVDNLNARARIGQGAAAINGLLTPPERGQVLENVRLGYTSILYVAPEQLRNRSFERTIAQREIGCWVFDEAHCISKWGHDFRPDYLYAGRFIREFSSRHGVEVPPVVCFTATAKRDVREEIVRYFDQQLGQQLRVFEAPVERQNLRFRFEHLTEAEKFPRVRELLDEGLNGGSAIVYCATRKRTEECARFLAEHGQSAAAFHAGLEAPEKRRIQNEFVSDTVRVICATNAFGMGIDKSAVRLVVHADIPGSLENYLQEAGRAGRDSLPAFCVLLFASDDIETQFKLAAQSQISHHDLVEILRGLRKARRKGDQPIALTSGELLRSEGVQTHLRPDDRGADTKVKTAVNWLERAGFVRRDENSTRVFQGKPKVASLQEARSIMDGLDLAPSRRRCWERLLQALINASPDEGLGVDELAEIAGIRNRAIDEEATLAAGEHILRTLDDMASNGLIEKGLQLTAFVRVGVRRASESTFKEICRLDRRLIEQLQEASPEADEGAWVDLSLRELNQRMLNQGEDSSTELVRMLLVSLAHDGAGALAGDRSSLRMTQLDRNRLKVKVLRNWKDLAGTAQLRRDVAGKALEILVNTARAAGTTRGETLVEFSTEDIAKAIREDLFLRTRVRDPLAAIDRGLLFLHEQGVIILQKGLAVFRQAMTIRLQPGQKGQRYSKEHYRLLEEHYRERMFQIHVMNRYAEVGVQQADQARHFVAGYFELAKPEFVQLHLDGGGGHFERRTSAKSYDRIVTSLRNREQESLVTAPANRNQLILAGPGSGKTRVVVHRCAYLLRVLRVPARAVLVVCFNRSAAWTVRRRLRDLIGSTARGVTIQTYHGLAARLTGHSFATTGESGEPAEVALEKLVPDAVRLLKGEVEVPGLEADELRDRLLEGYEYILVDEYQDIDPDQYELISAIAGRTLGDPDAKLSILAVGDDDQNIYTWRRANVEFIRRFEKDYDATKSYLVDNYRSTNSIIEVANAFIAHNHDRMKGDHPIRIDRARRDQAAGGPVRLLSVADDYCQSLAIVDELERHKRLDPEFDPSDFAILARRHRELAAIRHMCERSGIPVRWTIPKTKMPSLTRIREVYAFLEHLRERRNATTSGAELRKLLPGRGDWNELLSRILDAWGEEVGKGDHSVSSVLDFFYESLAEERLGTGLGSGVNLSTIHATKGAEYRHVFIADGGWRLQRDGREQEEERRVLYVAMTRAERTLTLLERGDQVNPHLAYLPKSVERVSWMGGTPTRTPIAVHRDYEMLGMRDLFLGLAGTKSPDDPIHERLARLRTHDTLDARAGGEIISLHDDEGHKVAQLSRQAAGRWAKRLSTIESIRVVAMIQRLREDEAAEYRDRCRCDRWEVPVAEVVFAPDTPS